MKIIFLILFSFSASAQNILICNFGQSNCGYSTGVGLSTIYTGDIANSYAWLGASWDVLNYTVDNNNQYPISQRNARHGTELSLCYELVNQLGYDTVFFVKYYYPSTYLCNTGANTWSPYAAGNLLDSAITTFNNAYNNLIVRGTVLEKTWAYLQQGESDCATDSCATNYQTNLTALKTKFFTNCTMPGLQLCIVRVNSGTTGSYVATVRTAETNVVAANPIQLVLFSTDAFSVGLNHFTVAGYEAIGTGICSYISEKGHILETFNLLK